MIQSDPSLAFRSLRYASVSVPYQSRFVTCMDSADTFADLVYISIATYFMGRWAGQKYRRYKKEFDPKVYPGKRWKMFPFIY